MNTPPNEADIESLTAKLYAVYCDAVGGKAFNGDPLPNWTDFATDIKKIKQAEAWRKVALYVLTNEN